MWIFILLYWKERLFLFLLLLLLAVVSSQTLKDVFLLPTARETLPPGSRFHRIPSGYKLNNNDNITGLRKLS